MTSPYSLLFLKLWEKRQLWVPTAQDAGHTRLAWAAATFLGDSPRVSSCFLTSACFTRIHDSLLPLEVPRVALSWRPATRALPVVTCSHPNLTDTDSWASMSSVKDAGSPYSCTFS